MKTLNLAQGSPEWIAHRFNHFNASELAAAMGISKKLKRNELLHMKATGGEREFSAYVREVILASGHRAEEHARAQTEDELGEDLFPIIGVSDDDPRLSVSFDGITATEKLGFECKVWNEELVAQVRAGELREEDFPDHIYQMEQALLISKKTEEIIFTVCREDGSEKVSMRYRSVPARRAKIIPTWNQFEEDLRAYVPAAPKAEVVAAAVETLPPIVYEIDRGTLSLTSNLPAFKAAVGDLVERTKAPLQTDQDFADRKALCKYLRETESNLKLKADEVIGQINDVATFSRALKDMAETIRVAALASEKLVEAEEKRRKQEIQQTGERALALHIEQLNTRFSGRVRMPSVTGDFAGATKGKRSLDSMQNAVDSELAKRKIEANEIADRISANLRALDEHAAEHLYLFNDLQAIAGRDPDAFEALVKLRVHEHKQREEARLKAEQERIERETRERIEHEARQKLADEQERIRREDEARDDRESRALADANISRLEVEKCDGNHGGPRCADPECWNDSPAKATGPAVEQVIHAVAPAPVAAAFATPIPAELPTATGGGETPRPTAREIVEAVADHFAVTEAVAAGWLLTLNQSELAKVA